MAEREVRADTLTGHSANRELRRRRRRAHRGASTSWARSTSRGNLYVAVNRINAVVNVKVDDQVYVAAPPLASYAPSATRDA